MCGPVSTWGKDLSLNMHPRVTCTCTCVKPEFTNILTHVLYLHIGPKSLTNVRIIMGKGNYVCLYILFDLSIYLVVYQKVKCGRP